jgi:hypothetical protein
MIIRQVGHYLVLITQPDHARLSGEIMARWHGRGAPRPAARDVILFAAREHDNGWMEPDQDPAVDPDSGRPYDFIDAPDALKQSVWPRGLERAGVQHPYAGALIAQHALTVYRRHRDQLAWASFFETIEGFRRRLLAAAGVDPRDLETDYQTVLLGDFVSLVFCNAWQEPLEAGGYRLRLSGRTLRLAPDPFGGSTVDLRVPARRIPARRYRSNADLRETLAAAPREIWQGTAVGVS